MAQLKVWNGSEWVAGHLKVWNGSGWVGLPKLWDGSAWIALAATLADPALSGPFLASAFSFEPSTAYASFTVTSNGDLQKTQNTNTQTVNDTTEWLPTADEGSGVGADYEVRADYVSGNSPSGTTGSWMSLSTSRTWSLSQSSAGSKSCDLTLRIRKAGDAASEVSADLSLSVSVELPF